MSDPAARAAKRIKREEEGPNYRCVFVPHDRMVAIIREEYEAHWKREFLGHSSYCGRPGCREPFTHVHKDREFE